MNVLVIAAHMDDEVLGVGGAIAKHRAHGDRVTVGIVCKRAYNHKFVPAAVKREKEDARRAARILDVSDLQFLDLRDELLDERLLDVIVPLEALVKRVKPTWVYTHHRGDSNQDHRAVAQASFIACRTLSRPKVQRVLSYEVPSSTDIAPPFLENAFLPNYYVNIAQSLETKTRALAAYRRELKEFPHPRSVEGVQVLAKKRGMEIGFQAAEAFAVVRDEWN